MPVLLDARVTAVTVHTDCARVTRRGRAIVAAGSTVVTVPGLPAATRPDSVRVAVFGAGVRVGDVDVAAGYEARVAPAGLGESVERLRAESAELADAINVMDRRLEALATVHDTGSRGVARAVVSGRSGVDAIDTFLDATMSRVADAQAERRELRRRKRAADEQLAAAEADVSRWAGEGPVLHREVRVALETTGGVGPGAGGSDGGGDVAGEVEVEVTAVVDGAGWEPAYDARLAADADVRTIELTAHGLVRQWTGEDWTGVDLTLSTSRPGRAVVVPELWPWVVAEERPVHTAALRAKSAADSVAAASAPMAAAAPAPVGAPLPPAAFDRAAVEQIGTAATFHIGRPVDIPADGSPHKVVITTVDLDAELDHVTVPKIAEEAYLRATVTNTSGTTLLAGRVGVHHGEQFVGTTAIETWPDGGETELQLGVDDRIEVERKLVSRGAGRGLLGPGRTSVGYETTVTNHMPVPARIAVVDHVPIAGRDDVKIKIDTLKPDPAERDELGVCTWRLELAPGAAATVRIAATVEHPRGMRLSGL